MKKIVVIGGGASGMFAAMEAAKSGADVTILEYNDILGKKILSTGNGRCNITNTDMKQEYYRGNDSTLVRNALEQISVEDVLDLFQNIGIYTKARGSYIYPRCDQAGAVRELLEQAVYQLGIHVITNAQVTSIRKSKNQFIIRYTLHTEKKSWEETLTSERVILATGSKASAVSGSDGSGYTLAKSLGHSIDPVVPALVQLRSPEKYFKKLSGIRTDATVKAIIEGQEIARDFGELQLTDYGISGIPVFQISRYIAKALHEQRSAIVSIDFLPDFSEETLLALISKHVAENDKMQAQYILGTLLSNKLAGVLLELTDIGKTLWIKKIPTEKWKAFIQLCKNFQVPITETNPFKQAQICAGGVLTTELQPVSMESRKTPGLYICGELLDVDGICGGYNLHFAWISGILAGRHAAK